MGIPMKGAAVAPTEPATSPALVVNPGLVAEMLFSTMVLYCPTGSRKTSQCGEFAKYIYEKTGKKTRMITMDGGGYGPVQDLVSAGIIDVWRMVEEENPKIALVKASRGAWPLKIVNGLRVGNIAEPMRSNRASALKDVGGDIVESWASIAKAVMRDAVAKGQKINEDVVSKFTEEEAGLGEESFGAPSRGHYGFAQNFILDIIRNFGGLPVERVCHTSLEGKGEDRLTKALQYGPEAAGSAITASIPQYVGDCLHFEDFIESKGTDPNNPSQKLIEESVRVWFLKHPDIQTGTYWPAKARLVPSKVPEFKKRMGEQGYFILGAEVPT